MEYTREEWEFVESLQGLGTREFIEALREYVAEPVLPSKGGGNGEWRLVPKPGRGRAMPVQDTDLEVWGHAAR